LSMDNSLWIGKGIIALIAFICILIPAGRWFPGPGPVPRRGAQRERRG
jgi:hypothetical protein